MTAGSLPAAPVLARLRGVLCDIDGTITSADEESAQAAPGLLTQHYAPQTPVRVTTDLAAERGGARVGVLAWRGVAHAESYGAVEVLSPAGDLREAAAGVFSALRRLDAAGMEIIVAELLPERELGRAVNDRLRRAAAG